MRVSNQLMQFRATNVILERQSELSKTQEQIATGRKILSPSDDPVGSTQILPLRELLEKNQQYIQNAGVAEHRLSLQDRTLDGVNNLLIRMKELAIQGNNDTLAPQDRVAVAMEIREAIQTLKGLANTKDANGDYLFSGHAVRTPTIVESPPGTFTYGGDNGQRFLQIGETRQIAVGDPGSDVFMNLPAAAGGLQSVFTTLETLATNFEADSRDVNALTDLDTAIDNTSTIRARVGSRLNSIDSQNEINEELKFQAQKALSDIEDLDLAEAVSRLNLQLVGLQASQQAFTRIQNLSLFNYL